MTDCQQIGLCLGCAGEAVGYGGRIMLYNNVFDDNAFTIQICKLPYCALFSPHWMRKIVLILPLGCLIISPALVSAGIYLTLKHIVISFGEKWSRLRPVWYTRVFIGGDVFSLILQGAGGGLASTADPGSSLQDTGKPSTTSHTTTRSDFEKAQT
jgi:hypothetical protein